MPCGTMGEMRWLEVLVAVAAASQCNACWSRGGSTREEESSAQPATPLVPPETRTAGPVDPRLVAWERKEIGNAMTLWWPKSALEQDLNVGNSGVVSYAHLGFLRLRLFAVVGDGDAQPLPADLGPTLKGFPDNDGFTEIPPPVHASAGKRVFRYKLDDQVGTGLAVVQGNAVVVVFAEHKQEWGAPPWLDDFVCQGIARSECGGRGDFDPSKWDDPPRPPAESEGPTYSLPGQEERVLVAQDAQGGWSRVRLGRVTAEMPGVPTIRRAGLVVDWTQVDARVLDANLGLWLSDMPADSKDLPGPRELLGQVLDVSRERMGKCTFAPVQSTEFAKMPAATVVGTCVNNGHEVVFQGKLLADERSYHYIVTTHLSAKRGSADIAAWFFDSVAAQ